MKFAKRFAPFHLNSIKLIPLTHKEAQRISSSFHMKHSSRICWHRSSFYSKTHTRRCQIDSGQKSSHRPNRSPREATCYRMHCYWTRRLSQHLLYPLNRLPGMFAAVLTYLSDALALTHDRYWECSATDDEVFMILQLQVNVLKNYLYFFGDSFKFIEQFYLNINISFCAYEFYRAELSKIYFTRGRNYSFFIWSYYQQRTELEKNWKFYI